MANFQQICRIKTDFNSKAPEMEIRENAGGKFLNGKITWLDGKTKEGKPKYTWFYFSTSKPEITSLFQNNPMQTFHVEGFLKNENWKDDKDNWKNRCEIVLTKAVIYEKEKSPVQSFHEVESDDESIPF